MQPISDNLYGQNLSEIVEMTLLVKEGTHSRALGNFDGVGTCGSRGPILYATTITTYSLNFKRMANQATPIPK